MGKKKSNATNAAQLMESKVSPILEINYADPLFSMAAHPTKPILIQGLATGHIYCSTYDAEKLEQQQQQAREEFVKKQTEAFKKGKVASIIKSVTQSKHKWWTVVDNIAEPEQQHITTLWKTKRHKGSCRSIIFDPLENSLGENVYSVGTDHIIKKALTETGKVTGKVDVSKDFIDATDAVTKLCHSPSNPLLLAGTEGGHVLVYDSSNLSKNKLRFKVPKAHDDCINHILPMPDVSAYHYLTLGSTTLSHIDIRKGIVTQSDDQEDELLSMCYASDHVNDHKNDTVLVSHGEGIVTIWRNSKNHWRDQLSRVKVNKGVSLDSIVPSMNCDSDDMTNSVWCGDSDGLLHRINYKKGKVVETRVHSTSSSRYGPVDEVGLLDIDYNYRLISSGMDSLKIWSEQVEEDVVESGSESGSGSDDDTGSDGSMGSDSDLDSDLDSDISGDEGVEDSEKNGINAEDCTDDSDDSDDSDEQVAAKAPGSNESSDVSDVTDSEAEDSASASASASGSDSDTQTNTATIQRKKRILSSKPKRKLVDLNTKTEPEPEPQTKKPKPKQLTNKQLRNMQQHEHGIRKFDDL